MPTVGQVLVPLPGPTVEGVDDHQSGTARSVGRADQPISLRIEAVQEALHQPRIVLGYARSDPGGEHELQRRNPKAASRRSLRDRTGRRRVRQGRGEDRAVAARLIEGAAACMASQYACCGRSCAPKLGRSQVKPVGTARRATCNRTTRRRRRRSLRLERTGTDGLRRVDHDGDVALRQTAPMESRSTVWPVKELTQVSASTRVRSLIDAATSSALSTGPAGRTSRTVMP